MKPTSEILERIARSSTEHKDGVFTRLYRYLLREDIYYAAYQKLYASSGAGTRPGTRGTGTCFGNYRADTGPDSSWPGKLTSFRPAGGY